MCVIYRLIFVIELIKRRAEKHFSQAGGVLLKKTVIQAEN